MKTFEKTLNCWKIRHLTLFGNINIVETFRLSKLIYNSSALVIPGNLIQEIENWDEKPTKIKESTINGERKHGGLN